MPKRMTIRRMSQRSYQRPMVAALSEHRQMFADRHAGNFRGDSAKFAPHIHRALRSHIDRIDLADTARLEEDEAGLNAGFA